MKKKFKQSIILFCISLNFFLSIPCFTNDYICSLKVTDNLITPYNDIIPDIDN